MQVQGSLLKAQSVEKRDRDLLSANTNEERAIHRALTSTEVPRARLKMIDAIREEHADKCIAILTTYKKIDRSITRWTAIMSNKCWCSKCFFDNEHIKDWTCKYTDDCGCPYCSPKAHVTKEVPKDILEELHMLNHAIFSHLNASS